VQIDTLHYKYRIVLAKSITNNEKNIVRSSMRYVKFKIVGYPNLVVRQVAYQWQFWAQKRVTVSATCGCDTWYVSNQHSAVSCGFQEDDKNNLIIKKKQWHRLKI